MALYRVRPGQTLGHHGQVLVAGDVVELPEEVATDNAVSASVEPVVPPTRPAAAPTNRKADERAARSETSQEGEG